WVVHGQQFLRQPEPDLHGAHRAGGGVRGRGDEAGAPLHIPRCSRWCRCGRATRHEAWRVLVAGGHAGSLYARRAVAYATALRQVIALHEERLIFVHAAKSVEHARPTAGWRRPSPASRLIDGPAHRNFLRHPTTGGRMSTPQPPRATLATTQLFSPASIP